MDDTDRKIESGLRYLAQKRLVETRLDKNKPEKIFFSYTPAQFE